MKRTSKSAWMAANSRVLRLSTGLVTLGFKSPIVVDALNNAATRGGDRAWPIVGMTTKLKRNVVNSDESNDLITG